MTIRYFETLPKPYAAFGKALLGITKKPPRDVKLPDLEFVVEKLSIDKSHLDKYNKICGFTQQGIVSPTYFAVLSQSLQMYIMSDNSFPFAMMGLVHINNRIKQLRVIKSNEVVRLSCKLANLKPHEKGLQFDFVTTVTVNGQEVWNGTTTYLRRGKTTDDGSKKPISPRAEVVYAANDIQTTWYIPSDIGRRYAAISGDINPIHMHNLTAKLLGFPRAIAHGMWTKAKCLGALGHLPDSFEVDVQFKLPVFLPATVSFKAQTSKVATFEMSDAKDGKPHLVGTITTL